MRRNFVNHHQSDWDLYLVDVKVAYNRSPNAVTTYSPFFLNYGYEPSTVPADLHRRRFCHRASLVTFKRFEGDTVWCPIETAAYDL